jgi:cytochrome b561
MVTNMTRISSPTYDLKTRTLHWLSAALVLALWLAGEFLDVFPKGTPRITVRSLHISFGLILGLLLAYRIWWRNHGGIQLPAPEGFQYARQAHLAHQVLYGVIALMVITGIALVWIRGDNLFNMLTVPAFDPGNKELRHNAKEVHGWIANGLLLGALAHALMALWHQRVLKDGLILRMLPARTR